MLLESCVESKECIICLLKNIKKALIYAKFDDRKSINLAGFRSDISQIVHGSVFKCGSSGDAMEAIEVFFNYIHYASFGIFTGVELGKNEDCSFECSAHLVCFNKLVEHWDCGCTSKRIINLDTSFALTVNSQWFFRKITERSNFFYDARYSELSLLYKYSELAHFKDTFSEIFKARFCEMLKKNEVCVNCEKELRVKIELISKPKMMIFHVHWDNCDKIEIINIIQFCVSLQAKVKMNELFESESEEDMGIRGIIVYLNFHYVYFTLGEDFNWYKIDDSSCFLVGAGRWYDVILNLVYMKGIIVGIIYEELHVADLSLNKLEVLFLEKIGYMLYHQGFREAGILDSVFQLAINPKINTVAKRSAEIKCVYCENIKAVGGKCDLCGFDSSQIEWVCENENCLKTNSGLNFMCDYCSSLRFKFYPEAKNCFICKKEREMICRTCDILFNCKKCGEDKTVLQSCFCMSCEVLCRDGYCKDDDSFDMICKMCLN